MNALRALLLIAAGYFAGSFSSAIVVTRIVARADIRELGNRNAGTANVGRSVGRGWAAVVFFLDVAKAVLPMWFARSVFPDVSAAHHAVVVFVGIAAIFGHCRPLYFGFRGGGGIATTFGAIAFVAPAEVLASMILGFLLVRTLVRTREYRIGRWTSGAIVLLIAPVVSIVSLFAPIPLGRYYRIGGHAWFVVAGVWVTVAFAIAMNRRLFRDYVRGLFGVR